MVFCCYENWGFFKRVVLDYHNICTQLVGVHQGVIHISPIHIALLRISILVYPVSVLLYDVASWTIGTDFMVSYVSVYGAMSHYLPEKCMTMQLDPQKRVRVRIQLHCDIDHLSSALVQYIPPPILKAINIAPNS